MKFNRRLFSARLLSTTQPPRLERTKTFTLGKSAARDATTHLDKARDLELGHPFSNSREGKSEEGEEG